MSEFQVVTCANREPSEPYYLFREFKASLARYGIEPVILGWGQPWGGLGSKPRLLKRAIEDGTITAERILWCDAFDVLVAGDPREIERIAGILWNAEKSCFPNANLAANHPETKSPWRYFNSGVSIGETKLYHKMLWEMEVEKIPDDHVAADGKRVEPNDQEIFMDYFLSSPRHLCYPRNVPMGLDSDCMFFQTLCGVTESELDLSGPRIRNTVTGTEPIVFHLNGPKEFWKPRLLAKLNL